MKPQLNKLLEEITDLQSQRTAVKRDLELINETTVTEVFAIQAHIVDNAYPTVLVSKPTKLEVRSLLDARYQNVNAKLEKALIELKELA